VVRRHNYPTRPAPDRPEFLSEELFHLAASGHFGAWGKDEAPQPRDRSVYHDTLLRLPPRHVGSQTTVLELSCLSPW